MSRVGNLRFAVGDAGRELVPGRCDDHGAMLPKRLRVRRLVHLVLEAVSPLTKGDAWNRRRRSRQRTRPSTRP